MTLDTPPPIDPRYEPPMPSVWKRLGGAGMNLLAWIVGRFIRMPH
jgi:hypothetical protein